MKKTNEGKILRLGILSTAGINLLAIINEIKKIEGIVLQAVASRNLKSAEDYANKYSIPQAYGSYEEILQLAYIDAVYISLPNAFHSEWTIKALNAGKNVLCEKPMATSVKEAQLLISAQKKSNKILMEAFHYRYHPVIKKVEEILKSEELGKVLNISAAFCQWLPGDKHIRYNQELKGGVLLDMGCYAVDAVCLLADCNSAKVISAETKKMHTGVDHTTSAKLLFANRVKASIYTTFKHFFPIELKVKATKGSLYLFSPFMPIAPIGENLRIPIFQLWIKKKYFYQPQIFLSPMQSTYYYQLCAFRNAIINNKLPITSPQNCLANTKIIEDIKQKAEVK